MSKRESKQGFTMIELLMVIMLVAILGAVALPQFLDFRNEGRIAAAQQLQNSFNVGLKLQLQQARLRCGLTDQTYAPMDSLAANDITAGSAPLCTASQVPLETERRFVDATQLPANPYNNLRTVGDCTSNSYVGWCYSTLFGTVSASTQTSAGSSSASALTASCPVGHPAPGSYSYSINGSCVDGGGDVIIGGIPYPCTGGSFSTITLISPTDPTGSSGAVTQGSAMVTVTCG